MKRIFFTICLGLVCGIRGYAADPEATLRHAERSRGVLTDTGVRWVVSVDSHSDTEGNKKARFTVTSQGGDIHAIVNEPADAEGRKYVEHDGNMWFWKPGLSRPVSVSRRQRLSGNAAIGDIASNSFTDGYKISKVEPGEANGEACEVFTLDSDSLSSTYKEIRYWISKSQSLGLKAEFFAKSGALVRSATMAYGNRATIDGQSVPFLSQMTVEDAGRRVNLSFSNVEIGNFPDDLFDRENLSDNVTRAKAGPRGR